MSDQHIYANGNLAYEMGHESGIVKLKNGKERKADRIVTNVYEKIDGHWLMISHHTHPKPINRLNGYAAWPTQVA